MTTGTLESCYLDALINEYYQRALNPDESGGVIIGALGLLKILNALTCYKKLRDSSRRDLSAYSDYVTTLEKSDDRQAEDIQKHLSKISELNREQANLVMLVKQLAHSIRTYNPDSLLAERAMKHLSAAGLISVEDLLR